MKNYSIILFFMVACFQNLLAQDTIKQNSLKWVASYKEAIKISKKEAKPILIYFKGSDWCAPCKVIEKELLSTMRFKELSDKNFILLEVDIPKQIDLLPAEKMADNYFIKSKFNVTSFPTFLIINFKGKVLAEKKGYILTDYYFPFFEEVLRKFKA